MVYASVEEVEILWALGVSLLVVSAEDVRVASEVVCPGLDSLPRHPDDLDLVTSQVASSRKQAYSQQDHLAQ